MDDRFERKPVINYTARSKSASITIHPILRKNPAKSGAGPFPDERVDEPSSIQITCDIYGHLLPTENKSTLDALDTPSRTRPKNKGRNPFWLQPY